MKKIILFCLFVNGIILGKGIIILEKPIYTKEHEIITKEIDLNNPYNSSEPQHLLWKLAKSINRDRLDDFTKYFRVHSILDNYINSVYQKNTNIFSAEEKKKLIDGINAGLELLHSLSHKELLFVKSFECEEYSFFDNKKIYKAKLNVQLINREFEINLIIKCNFFGDHDIIYIYDFSKTFKNVTEEIESAREKIPEEETIEKIIEENIEIKNIEENSQSKYTVVKYNTKGGLTAIDAVRYDNNKINKYEFLPSPIKDGYNFKHWVDQENKIINKNSIVPKTNIILNAIYTKK